MNNLIRNKVNNGFSLVELLLVLAIIAALSITAFYIYTKVKLAQTVEVETQNISNIRAELLRLYSSSNNITTINNTVAINAGIFPDSMLVKKSGQATTVLNSLKGKVTVSATNFASYGKVYFNISYEGLTPDVCTKLSTAVQPAMKMVLINGNYVKSDLIDIKWDLNKAIDACNSIKNPTMTISFN